MNDEFLIENCQLVYTPTLITAKSVIPAKAGIQPPAHEGLWPGGKSTGFRVKPGMTKI